MTEEFVRGVSSKECVVPQELRDIARDNSEALALCKTRFTVAVEKDLPPCSNCGARDYVAGYFEPEGQLFRCEACKTCFKPNVELTLTATIEPLPHPDHCEHGYAKLGMACPQCKSVVRQ